MLAPSSTSVLSPVISTQGDASLLALKRDLSPDEFAKELRSKGDLYYWAPGKFWVITRHGLAMRALRRPELSADRSSFFISRMPNLDLRLIKDFFGVVSKMMVMSDDEQHSARRRAALETFSEMGGATSKDIIKRVVAEAMSQIAEDTQSFDFVQALAKKIPADFLAELFGITKNFREEFFACSANMTEFFGGASQYRNQDGEQVNHSAVTLRDYFSGQIARCRSDETSDFIGRFVCQGVKLGLSDDEMVAQLIMILVAGQVTSTDQICNNFFTLLEDSSRYKWLASNPASMPLAVDELNRWDPGVTFLFRVVRAPVELEGVKFVPGDVIFFANHAINRDEAVFQNPHELDLSRSKNPHFAFGSLAHYCVGAPVARIMMQEVLQQLAARFPLLRLSERGFQRNHYSLAFSGFREMWIDNLRSEL